MKNIRNIAIIAHVDHGKTTLVDQLLKFSGTFRENEQVGIRVMDNNDIEKERGITIVSKPTAINYKDYRINILDTPGHADFGGEVERIMNMVDGVILVVDAFEGTMPQTRFVLKQALEYKLKPIVVVNKVDRPNADIQKTLDEVLELFIELGADDSLLDYKVIFCSALKGTSSYSMDLNTQREGMDPIFETIINEIPSPNTDANAPFQFQPSLLDYNDYVGKIGVGRVERGTVHVGDIVTCMRLDNTNRNFKIQKLYGYIGLQRVEIEKAEAGDICAIAGLSDINVGETICDPANLEKLPPLRIDEPTMQMTFAANHSPFAGKEGKLLTSKKIEDRLFKESQKDVSLKFISLPSSESYLVTGRGELHLSVLIETMRREGFELQVSKPEVIKKEIDGEIYEPFEDLQIDVPDQYVGKVMELLGDRFAELINMNSENGQTRINYVIPSRGLISFSSNFMVLTSGYGIANHSFKEYRKVIPQVIGKRKLGVLVATDTGMATAYALKHTEERGQMFITPGVEVYEGMIVGENKYAMDMGVNVVQTKSLGNQRSANKDFTVVLKAARKMSLEDCLDYINHDELLEVTPSSLRMRKKILNLSERKKYEAHHPEEYK